MANAAVNHQQWLRAQQVLVGGVNSPVRAAAAVGAEPLLLTSGQGPYVRDVDGRQYLDLVGAWGPALLGHAHPPVVEAVQESAAHGLGFGAPHPGETRLGELVRERVPMVERLRLVSTGTEAAMTAVRLARAATGRDVIVKFAGHYHGHSDGLLAQAGSGVATLSLPDSAGVPAAYTGETVVVEYQDLAAVEAALQKYPVAAVIVEAAAANMGVVAPDPGFNQTLTDLAHRYGALVIGDEVLTGFRVGPAGWWGLEGTWNPDLLLFGKVIGGGLPVAALGGSAALMDLLAPLGPVYQAGTLSGNPVAVAAGIATLEAADEAVYAKVDRASVMVAELVAAAFAEAGVPAALGRAGNLISWHFGSSPQTGWAGLAPRNYREVLAGESWRYPPFFRAMRQRGVSLPPSPFEAWFVGATHDPRALEVLAAALPDAVAAAAQAQPPR